MTTTTKSLITLFFLTISSISNGQFLGDWFTFRTDEILYENITEDKLTKGRIGKYKTPKEYTINVNTFTIKEKFVVNDSILYIVTNQEPDDLMPGEELQIHKYVYNKNSNTLTTFYYNTVKDFYNFKSGKKNITKKDIEEFIAKDTSTIGYVTFYTKDTLDLYLSYPKLVDQPTDVIIKLYNKLTSVYAKFHQKTEEEKMPYFLMKGLSKSVIESPAYIELKICPLTEEYEETDILEKFEETEAEDVIQALYKLRATRNQ